MYVIDGIAYAGEPSEIMKVTDVRVVDTLCLIVTFSTGETRIFDAEPLLQYPVYEPLKDPSVFQSVHIEGSTIVWQNGDIDIAPETLYQKSLPYEYQAQA